MTRQVASRTSSLKDKIKLRQRCALLVEVAKQLGTLYDDPGTTATQRHYIETIVGAALWYLPTSRELWTGGISVAALKDFPPQSGVVRPRLTEDHEFPRKVSAVELMRRSWSEPDCGSVMLDLYLQRYGRFNYITPTENKVLVKYQKTHLFQDPLSAYKQANVHLVVITHDELNWVRKRDSAMIETCLARAL